MDSFQALGLLAAAILFRIFLKPFLRTIASRTKTKLDDKILDAVTNPLWFIVLLFVLDFFVQQYVPNTYVHNVIYTLIAVLVAVIVYRLAKILIFDVIGSSSPPHVDAKTKRTALLVLQNVTLAVVLVITLAYVFTLWGVNITPLLASAGIAGLAIGLALKDPLENLFYGVMLALDPAFRVGDIVDVDGTVGEVKEIGLRNTKILTFSGDIVTLPNSRIANSRVLNYHLPSDRVRVTIRIGVSYGSDPNEVKKTLEEIARSSEYVLDNPPPQALFMEYGDFALLFELRFWTSLPVKLLAIDDVNTKIWYTFKEKGIEIPFPIREIYLRGGADVLKPQ